MVYNKYLYRKAQCPANRSKSEPLSENVPFMHRKYMPISAINTPIHILTPHFLLRKIPSIGTISIYVAVRNPALPDSAPMLIPSCCRLLAKKSAIPQQLPAIQSSFFAFAFRSVYRQLFLIQYFYDRQKAERTNKEADAVE